MTASLSLLNVHSVVSLKFNDSHGSQATYCVLKSCVNPMAFI